MRFTLWDARVDLSGRHDPELSVHLRTETEHRSPLAPESQRHMLTPDQTLIFLVIFVFGWNATRGSPDN
jgi:hypothetical protein